MSRAGILCAARARNRSRGSMCSESGIVRKGLGDVDSFGRGEEEGPAGLQVKYHFPEGVAMSNVTV